MLRHAHVAPCLRMLAFVQGTRRVVMRTALPRDFTSAVFNPLAMSSRGRYLLVEGLPTTSTSGKQLRLGVGVSVRRPAMTACLAHAAAPQRHPAMLCGCAAPANMPILCHHLSSCPC